MFVFIRVFIAVALLAFLVQQAQVVRLTNNDGQGPIVIVRIIDGFGKTVISSTNSRISKQPDYTCPSGEHGIGGETIPVQSFPVTVVVEVFDRGGLWYVEVDPPGYVDVNKHSTLLTKAEAKLGGSKFEWFEYNGDPEIAHIRKVFTYEISPKPGKEPMVSAGRVIARDYFGNDVKFEGPLLFSPDWFCSLGKG